MKQLTHWYHRQNRHLALIWATVIQTSFILNERKTRFAGGMEKNRSDLLQSIRHQEIFKPHPGNFGSMDCPRHVERNMVKY